MYPRDLSDAEREKREPVFRVEEGQQEAKDKCYILRSQNRKTEEISSIRKRQKADVFER
ncbi:MAG: hypothetical protein LBC45_05480 [Chlamydiales bacterium]|jgi:hypothetical protein|nr:hypothetical protein [Chlamydiales bacterium]